ncbi:unnamed protein product [Pocillopora meandrina]|uniref:cystathionine gamma-lyase n=1 Tax=Pocillopora meandrina TaxID=46732 RepID=A0AAU9WI75_9CNID|nr:unnamed protein product [Pocillopora meandrina]
MMIVQRSRLLLFRVLRHFVPRSTLSSSSKMANEAEQTNLKPFPHFGTLAIHAGQEPEQWNSRAVVPPISMATTFKQDDPGVHRGFEYSRSGNPTRNCFEACVAALEGAKHGLATSSGLSATMLLTHLLKSGEHIVCVDDVYGGTNRYFSKVAAANMGIEISMVDASDLSKLKAAIKPKTKMVWIETPTNPLLKLVDIQGAAEVVHQHEVHLDYQVLVKRSTSYFFIACTSKKKIREYLLVLSWHLFTFSYIWGGAKTLHLRMRQHEINATAVAKFLEGNPRVEKVMYPGLESYPQHELAKKQMTGFGGMVTFFHQREFGEFQKVFQII